MRDRTTKVLLLLIFLALVLNAFIMLARPGLADGGQLGRYAIVAYGYYHAGDHEGRNGYYKIDTVTGEVSGGR